MFRRILCRVFGHQWIVLKKESKFSPVLCVRCESTGEARYSAWRAEWDLINV